MKSAPFPSDFRKEFSIFAARNSDLKRPSFSVVAPLLLPLWTSSHASKSAQKVSLSGVDPVRGSSERPPHSNGGGSHAYDVACGL